MLNVQKNQWLMNPAAVSPWIQAVVVSLRAATLPIAPAVTSPATSSPAPTAPVAYVPSLTQSCHRSERLSADDIARLQASWHELTPSLDRQDVIPTVNHWQPCAPTIRG